MNGAGSSQGRLKVGAFALCVAVTLNAAAAMVLEITAGRLLAPYFGMSLYSWTSVIGVVLAGLTAGHWVGGRLAQVSGEPLIHRLSLAFWAGAAASALVLPLLGGLLSVEKVRGLAPAPALILVTFAVFFLPSLLAGLVQPMASKHALEIAGGLSGRVLGRMLAMGALGSILGTFLAGFVLISYVGTVGTVWLVAAVNLALGALFMPSLSRLLGFLGAGAAAGILGFTAAGDLAFATPCDQESQYFCIQVDDASPVTGRASRLIALDHLVHSINDQEDPQRLASPYLHLVDEITLRLFPEGPGQAFFIGGGGYTLPRAWQDRWPRTRMTVAEIDPEVTRTARERMWFESGPAITTLHFDARAALRRSEAQYQVVFGDAFQDIAIPQHLVTKEFYDLIAGHLTEDGFYVLNLIDDPREPRFLASMVRTLELTFPTVEVWVAPEDLPGARRVTFVVFAATAASALPNRLNARGGYAREWAQIETERLQVERLGRVLSDDHAPVDRLLRGFWTSGG